MKIWVLKLLLFSHKKDCLFNLPNPFYNFGKDRYDIINIVFFGTSIKHVDTCSLVKSNLYLFNNRLNTVGKFLVDDEKLDHEGWDLWVKVHEKNPEAMATMEKYCIQDVDLLDKVFTELRPFAKNLPNKNLYRSAQKIINEGEVCPTCGSDNLIGWGWYHTKTDSFQRFRCKDCNATCRGTQKNKQLRSL